MQPPKNLSLETMIGIRSWTFIKNDSDVHIAAKIALLHDPAERLVGIVGATHINPPPPDIAWNIGESQVTRAIGLLLYVDVIILWTQTHISPALIRHHTAIHIADENIHRVIGHHRRKIGGLTASGRTTGQQPDTKYTC